MSAKKRTITIFLLILTILLQTAIITWLFATRKSAFHSDEIYSYSLSNSYYQPFFSLPGSTDIPNDFSFFYEDGHLYLDTAQTGYIDTYEWISGSRYLDFLTVQQGKQFSYASVLYNQSQDVHPPFYYLLLHTVSSFFPDRFSVWFSYGINLAAMIGIQLFLYQTALLISKSRFASFLCCLLYGFSAGALSTMVFLRQYALQTMLCMCFTYLSIKMHCDLTDKAKPNIIYSIFTSCIAFLAFMTHYYSIAYIGVFTALYCLYLGCHNKYRFMLCYGLSMFVSLLCFFITWPSFYRHMFGNLNTATNANKLSFPMQFVSFFQILLKNCFGLSFTQFHPIGIIQLVGLLVIAILSFAALVQKMKKRSWTLENSLLLIIMLSSLSIYLIASVTADITIMEEFSIRYIFISFPMLCLLFVLCISGAFEHISFSNHVLSRCLTVFLILLTVLNTHIQNPSPFLLSHYGQERDTAELLRGKNVVVIYNRMKNTFFCANWMAPYLLYADNVFLVSADLAENYLEDIEELNGHIDYVLVKSDVFASDPSNQTVVNQILLDCAANSYVSASSLEKMKFSDITGSSEPTTPETYDSSDPNTQLQNSLDRLNAAPPECSPLITQMNGGCIYDVLYGLNLQNSTMFYVLELK